MSANEIKIGDRVKVKEYYDIPEDLQSRGLAKMCGEIGTVEDKFYSEGQKCHLYSIQFDNYATSKKLWKVEMLESVDEDVSYTYEFDYLDNVVVARLYELREDSKTEIARGHGHIIHEGVMGIAQAASYALRKIFYQIEAKEGDEDDSH